MSFSEARVPTPNRQDYDTTPIGSDPWTSFLTEQERVLAQQEGRLPERRSHHRRGLDAIDAAIPLLPLPIADICTRALYSSLTLECVRNEHQANRFHKWASARRPEWTESPPDAIKRIHEAEGPTALAYATLTHVGDWDADAYVDHPVTAALLADPKIETEMLVDEYPHVKLKTFDERGQVIVVKHDVATHYGGEIVSKRRYMVGVDLEHPDTDPDLARAILAARGEEKEFDYECTRDTIGSLLLPQLVVRSPSITPLRTSRYGVHVARALAEAEERRKASKPRK